MLPWKGIFFDRTTGRHGLPDRPKSFEPTLDCLKQHNLSRPLALALQHACLSEIPLDRPEIIYILYILVPDCLVVWCVLTCPHVHDSCPTVVCRTMARDEAKVQYRRTVGEIAITHSRRLSGALLRRSAPVLYE